MNYAKGEKNVVDEFVGNAGADFGTTEVSEGLLGSCLCGASTLKMLFVGAERRSHDSRIDL